VSTSLSIGDKVYNGCSCVTEEVLDKDGKNVLDKDKKKTYVTTCANGDPGWAGATCEAYGKHHLTVDQFKRDANPAIDCTDGALPTSNFIQFKVVETLKKGNYWIKFGGVTNPLSFSATDNFQMLTQDAKGSCVSFGSLDNIAMTSMGEF